MVKQSQEQATQPECVICARQYLRDSFFSTTREIKALLEKGELSINANKEQASISDEKTKSHIVSAIKKHRTDTITFSQLITKNYTYVLGRKEQSK